VLNYNRLKKDQILFLYNNRCKAHNMRYTEHPACYDREKPDCSLINERVGFLDLECSNLDANWGIILSYCIKVKDSDKIYQGVINKSDVAKFHADQTDKRILTQLIKDLQNFDRIVAHFGRRFDIPYMRTRALMMGLDFPAFGSIKNDDTWVFAKKKLKLNSNRLDTIEMALFGEAKKTRLMSKYWIGAARGDTDALKYIVDHNIQDVLTLERIWYKLRDFSSCTNCSI
jgi:uncharacterized protein YprB with RNaseH-like and TPR domain